MESRVVEREVAERYGLQSPIVRLATDEPAAS